MPIRTILVIDDSEALVHHVAGVLRRKDRALRLLSARDGLDGFKVLLSNRVDLVLCDLMMTGIDGFKFLSLKQCRPEFAEIPVIMLGGASDVGAKAKGLEAGAADYLVKPFLDAELLARVEVHLKLKCLTEEFRDQTLRLEEVSNTDGLTMLNDRRHFFELGKVEVLRAKRSGSSIACVMLDLDHFRAVNDEHGHQKGDQVLRAVADTLRKGLRDGDLAARYGGEEFVVLLPTTDLAGGRAAAERYRQRIAQLRIAAEDAEIMTTASMGIAALPEQPAESLDELLRAAERALYRAKGTGRNCVVAATDPAASLVKH